MDTYEELTTSFITNLIAFEIACEAIALKIALSALECEEEEEEDDDWDWEDDYDECGYNPYLGCYDFDC